MTRLTQWFKSLPRAARWLIVFIVFVAAYFLVVEPVLDRTSKWNGEADRAKLALARYKQQAQARAAADTSIALGVTRMGDVAMPDELRARSNILFTRIGAILDAHGIARPSITAGRPIPLGRGVLQELCGPNEEIQRLIFDIKLEAEPEAIMRVLADLERTPEVTMLGQVQLRRSGKDDERKLQATIMPEAWVIAERGGGTRR